MTRGGSITLAQIIWKRFLQALPLLFILSVISFGLVRALPGDPVEALLGESTRDISREELAFMRKRFGLDDPLPIQYARWLMGWAGHGELGRSYQDNRPVLEVILERLPATILLTGTAIIISFSTGTVWGLVLVFIRSRWPLLEGILLTSTLFLYSIPAFLTALALVYLAADRPTLHFIPVFARLDLDRGSALVALLPFVLLPAFSLALGRAAKVALFIRSLALDEIERNYVTLAIAKGMPYFRVILVHVSRNCLLPVLNLLALSLPALIGGSVLIESIFGWPGTGRLAVDATFGRNYPVMTSLIMLYGTMVILGNLLADLIAPFIDPRLRDEIETAKAEDSVRLRKL